MGGQLRRWGARVGTGGALALCLWLSASSAIAAPVAHRTHTLRLSQAGSLHLVKKNGAILRERGTATGTLPGTVSARFDTSNAAKVTGSVTFYPYNGGSLTVNVVGYPQSLGTVAKFSGRLAVRGGSGRFARALGSGSFSGTVNRRTWAISVHAKGKITY